MMNHKFEIDLIGGFICINSLLTEILERPDLMIRGLDANEKKFAEQALKHWDALEQLFHTFRNTTDDKQREVKYRNEFVPAFIRLALMQGHGIPDLDVTTMSTV